MEVWDRLELLQALNTWAASEPETHWRIPVGNVQDQSSGPGVTHTRESPTWWVTPRKQHLQEQGWGRRIINCGNGETMYAKACNPETMPKKLLEWYETKNALWALWFPIRQDKAPPEFHFPPKSHDSKLMLMNGSSPLYWVKNLVLQSTWGQYLSSLQGRNPSFHIISRPTLPREGGNISGLSSRRP